MLCCEFLQLFIWILTVCVADTFFLRFSNPVLLIFPGFISEEEGQKSFKMWNYLFTNYYQIVDLRTFYYLYALTI